MVEASSNAYGFNRELAFAERRGHISFDKKWKIQISKLVPFVQLFRLRNADTKQANERWALISTKNVVPLASTMLR